MGEFVNINCEIFSLVLITVIFNHVMAALRAVQRQIRTVLTYNIYRNVKFSSLNVVGRLMLNLLPWSLEWPLILKLKC